MTEIFNIDTAQHGEVYQIFIPESVAKTIDVSLDDGYGSHYDSTLTEGFYTAYCDHNIYAIGQPKNWSIYLDNSYGNNPESDNKDIKAIKISDLKTLMGV